MHVDFLRLGEGAQVRVRVPIHVNNADQAPGIKRGGTVNIVTHTIAVQCRPTTSRRRFEVDLTGLEINYSQPSERHHAAAERARAGAWRHHAGHHRAAVGLRGRNEGRGRSRSSGRGSRRTPPPKPARRRPTVRTGRTRLRPQPPHPRPRPRRSKPRAPSGPGRAPGPALPPDGLIHAAVRRARQSGRQARGQPPQHRIHGGRRDRQASRLSAVAAALSGRRDRRHDRPREGAAAAARHLHERVRAARSPKRMHFYKLALATSRCSTTRSSCRPPRCA